MFLFVTFLFHKLASPEFVGSCILVRGIVNFHISYQILKITKLTIQKDKIYLKFALLRAAVGILNTYLCVLAVVYLDLNHVVTLFNTSPVFGFVLGYYFMGDVYSHERLLCTFGAVFGVILVTNPHFIYLDFSTKEAKYENFYLGCFIAISGGFLKAIVWILVKKISSSSLYNTMLIFE